MGGYSKVIGKALRNAEWENNSQLRFEDVTLRRCQLRCHFDFSVQKWPEVRKLINTDTSQVV